MSRAILLPSTGDPYITAAWITAYKKYCEQHVDKLYVCINSSLEEKVANYVVDSFKALGAEVLQFDKHLDHGPALTSLLDICKEDYVFVAEDDFYIQHPTILDQWFKEVESGNIDMIGSKRGCVGPEIIKSTVSKFNLTSPLDHQPNFWPCLIVVKASDLRRTDKNFAAKRFEAGKHIPQLSFTPTVSTGGDTFVWASIQLRALGLKIKDVNQNRFIDVITSGNFPPPWVHLGSSSTSLNGHLLDENMIPIGNTLMTKPMGFPPVPDEGIREHHSRKFAYYKVFNNAFPIEGSSDAAYFNKLYRDAVSRTIQGCALPPAKVSEAETVIRKILQPIL